MSTTARVVSVYSTRIEPERAPGQEAPVRAGEALEVHRVPDALEVPRLHDQRAALDRADGAVVAGRRLVGEVADDARRGVGVAAAHEERDQARDGRRERGEEEPEPPFTVVQRPPDGLVEAERVVVDAGRRRRLHHHLGA